MFPVLGDVVRLEFSTSAKTGGRVNPSSAITAGDFRIYKNGSTTEKTTTNGISVSSPFDNLVGLHILSIDTGNSAGDSGFWEPAGVYHVAFYPASITVDSESVAAWVGAFELGVPAKISQQIANDISNEEGDWPDAVQLIADKVIDEGPTNFRDLGITGDGYVSRVETVDEATVSTASVNEIATDTRDAILDRVLAGNHDDAGSVGKVLQETLQAALDCEGGGGGGGLTGPYALTVAVQDNGDSEPIENATVRVYRTGETGTLQTNDAGDAVFAVNAATWSYAVTAAGYAGSTGQVVVSGDDTLVISLQLVAVPAPSSPDLSVLQVLCVDGAGQVQGDVAIDVRLVSVPAGSTNTAYLGAKQTWVSGNDGVASGEVVRRATYEIKRGQAAEWARVMIPDADVATVTSIVGAP
jgi:hypothetical protein